MSETDTNNTGLTVVCPLNGNPSAERALPSAFDAAALFDAELTLFSAVVDSHMVGRRRDYLDLLGAQRRCSGAHLPLSDVVVDPHAPRAIAERSASPSVLTVMATSSQPLLHTGYIGSAAERTTREAFNPSLLVGPHNKTRLCDVDRVVVACDGSQLSESALPHARTWADRLDVELWVITSLSPRDLDGSGYSSAAEPTYVRRLAKRFDAQWEVLHGPDPAKAIVQWAGPSLIAMTSHGRNGLSRLTVGSVTTAVTRWATGPVLVANSRRALDET